MVSRSQNHLDAFAVGSDGRVYTAAWQPGDNGFRGWWKIGKTDLEVPPCSTITAVSRSVNKLDVFVTGIDGRVYTAAWEPSDGGNGWRGWWPVANIKAQPGSPIGAVSRSANKLDVFIAGADGKVWTAAWEPSDGGNGFRGWWKVGDLTMPPAAPITVVSRSKDKLDVFATGVDGRVYTAAWEPSDGSNGFRGWWSVAGGLATPGAPVGVVSRSADKLDVFVTGLNNRVWTAAWQPSDGSNGFRGWWQVGNLAVPPRTWISAVSRSTNKLDIFATGSDGHVYTAAWEPGDARFRGWFSVASGQSQPGGPVGAISRSSDKLDVIITGLDSRVWTAAWEPSDGTHGFRGWWRVGTLVMGMTDPEVGQWFEAGTAFYSENTGFSEEAQGMTTDGAFWYFSSNGDKTVRKFDNSAQQLGRFVVPPSARGGHVGPASYYDGWLYVPIEGPTRVFKISTTNFPSSQTELHPVTTVDGHLAWCAVNPLNGRLYTAQFDIPQGGMLFSYDRNTLERHPEDDINLGPTPFPMDSIQGGVFTARGRVILVSSGPNAAFVFSARTGFCFGAKELGDFGSSGSEVESVTVRDWVFNGGLRATVHILELDNDFWSEDDAYLHSYSVPRLEL